MAKKIIIIAVIAAALAGLAHWYFYGGQKEEGCEVTGDICPEDLGGEK